MMTGVGLLSLVLSFYLGASVSGSTVGIKVAAPLFTNTFSVTVTIPSACHGDSASPQCCQK